MYMAAVEISMTETDYTTSEDDGSVTVCATLTAIAPIQRPVRVFFGSQDGTAIGMSFLNTN